MSNGLPTKARVGDRNQSVEISPATYFIAKRMESVGMLQPGQALMLAATLPQTTKPQSRGRTKRGKR